MRIWWVLFRIDCFSSIFCLRRWLYEWRFKVYIFCHYLRGWIHRLLINAGWRVDVINFWRVWYCWDWNVVDLFVINSILLCLKGESFLGLLCGICISRCFCGLCVAFIFFYASLVFDSAIMKYVTTFFVGLMLIRRSVAFPFIAMSCIHLSLF